MSRAVQAAAVTVLIGELEGSTSLGERLAPETLRRVMGRYSRTMSAVVERHGGAVERFIGDAVMAVFRGPEGALAATRAAAGLGEALGELDSELDRDWGVRVTVRIAVSTGAVAEPADADAVLTGEAVDAAGRLLKTARAGEVLLADSTLSLLPDVVRAEHDRRREAPMLGRETELAHLVQTFDRAAGKRRAHLVTIVGPPGIGKSRLAEELSAALEGRARTLVGRCLPYGTGVTFWPLAEILRQATGEQGRSGIERTMRGDPEAALIADRLAHAVGMEEGEAGVGEETAWAARRFLEALARERPLLLVLEDLHWGEAPFLDLVEHLSEHCRDAPIVVLCLARPELLERRRRWLGGKLNAAALLLEPLSIAESETLVDELTAGEPLPERVGKELVAGTEGNPLFVEQTLALVRERDSAADEQPLPSTIQALLDARLHGLEPAERAVLERASVVGEEFWAGAVRALSPLAARGELDARLEALARKELIRPMRSSDPGERAFRFRHILIRDAAYNSLAAEWRADLHKRFAEWIESTYPTRLSEHEEILGYHLEQAHGYRTAMALVDGETRELGRAAGARLASAGRRAFDREDMSGAANLLSRALRLLPPDTPGRLDLYPTLGEALEATGRHGEAGSLLDEAIGAARAAGDRRAAARSAVRRAGVRFLVEPERSARELLDQTRSATAVLEELGDDWGLAEAWRLVGNIAVVECRGAEAERALERALEHAGRAGSLRRQALISSDLAWCLLEGPAPLDAARRFGEEWLTFARTKGSRTLEAWVLQSLGAIEARRGRFADGRRLLAICLEICEELGLTYTRAWAESTAGLVELVAGDPAAAERELRPSYATFEGMGVKTSLAETAVMLAEALCRQGRLDEAQRLTEVCEHAAPSHDAVCQVRWRTTRGKVLAMRGSLSRGEELAWEAHARAADTDFLCLRVDVLTALAEVLQLSGRPGEAGRRADDALRLAREKRYEPGALAAQAITERAGQPLDGRPD